MHPRTKKFKKLTLLFSLLSFFCFFGPLIYFGSVAFFGGALIISKLTFTASVFISIIVTIASFGKKWVPRSRVWIILLGLYFCIDNFIAVILAFAITQIIDELILCPLKHYCSDKASMNHEIDARGGI